MTAVSEEYWKWFGTDYSDARQKFLNAAQSAEAKITNYQHPTVTGPNKEPLFIDVAHIGRADAPKVLLAISGTHGLEGPAGSAIQTAWLATQKAVLPDDIAIVYVHAINPYGFAYETRTTENNVDLNRNFVDHNQPYPENKDYALLHKALLPATWTAESQQKADQVIADYRKQFGDDKLFNTRAKGQYDFPDGLSFGGNAREWSNVTLQKIIETHLTQAQQVAFIDWHTGLGDYAEPYFLCFNQAESAFQKEAARWWGYDLVIGQHLTGIKRPEYQGLVFRGAEHFLGGRPFVGAVIEFGTRKNQGGEGLRLDQWLRFHAKDHPELSRDTQLKADLKDAFVPVSSIWRRSVIKHGIQITQQAVDGLLSWTV